MLAMFRATTPAWAAPGRAALCDPVSAISPREKILVNLSSFNCKVGLTRMQPLVVFSSDVPDFSASFATKLLLGFCPVAMMIMSVVKVLPPLSSIWKLLPSSGKPSDGTLTLLPVMSLRDVVNTESRGKSLHPSGK